MSLILAPDELCQFRSGAGGEVCGVEDLPVGVLDLGLHPGRGGRRTSRLVARSFGRDRATGPAVVLTVTSRLPLREPGRVSSQPAAAGNGPGPRTRCPRLPGQPALAAARPAGPPPPRSPAAAGPGRTAHRCGHDTV